MKKSQKIFLTWFALVVAWNFLVPGAQPIYDVLVATVLFFFFNLLNQKA